MAITLITTAVPIFAYRTTITSSVFADSTNNLVSDIPSRIIRSGTPRVTFINNVSAQIPTLENALSKAACIFTDAMEAENIDLVPIQAEIVFGNSGDFLPYEVCKVEVVYTDTIGYDPYFYRVSRIQQGDYPLLFPLSLSNQSRKKSSGTAMTIKLRPNISLHCDTTPPPSTKYDAITLFLRALAIGCGIQSSLDHNNASFGIEYNNQTYMTVFDLQARNQNMKVVEDVIDGTISLTTFLANNKIYADADPGLGTPIQTPIRLYNDWEKGLGSDLSFKTMNSISDSSYTAEERANDFLDLMDYRFSKGTAIRDVTLYSWALLRQLGWEYTLPVGQAPPFNELYSCSLNCSDSILFPNINYSVGLSDNSNVNIESMACELMSMNNSYSIGTFNSTNNSWSFSYNSNSLPNNIQWKRNPITKTIIGRIKADVWQFDDGIMWSTKYCDIEIPYRPNKPIIKKSEHAHWGTLQVPLEAFANGSDTYTVTWTGLTDNDTHTFTVTADAIDTTLAMPATQLYEFAIYGTNVIGNSDTFYFTVGTSVPHNLNLTITNDDKYLSYDLTDNGEIDPRSIYISSVKILNRFGLVCMSPGTHTNPINISSLSRGGYVLTIVANGQTYSKLFVKLNN